ncbi:MAG: DUF4130 domain-containing protein, partial [Treponema sp.]|nr:DUF4130 domain-containing protein [Treponema sp.]
MGSEFYYDGSLEGFLALLDRFRPGDPADWPRRVMRHTGGAGLEPGRRPDQRPGQEPDQRPGQRQDQRSEDPQGLLFDEGAAESGAVQVPPALFPDPASLGGAAAVLFQVSSGAYDALVHVWMSGLPLEAQALRYALGTLAAAEKAALAAEGPAGKIPGGCTVPWYAGSEAREGAERAARNRGDEDCRIVLAAAYKVVHEIDRLMGFLRFKPGAGGR